MSLLLLLRSGQNFTQTITDNAGSTDSVSTITQHLLTVTDPSGNTDSASTVMVFSVSVTDLQNLSDSLALPPLTDLLGMTDSIAFVVNHSMPVDLAALTDQILNTPQPAYSDASAMTDTISFSQGYGRIITDDGGLTDSVLVALTRSITVTDNAGLTDPVIPGQILKLQIDDVAGLTDAFAFIRNASVSIQIDELMGIADNQSFIISPVLTDTAGSSDTTGVGRYTTLADDAGLSDSVATQKTSPQILTLTIDDNAGAADTTTPAATFPRTVVDLAALTDSVFAGKYISVVVVDTTMASPSDTIAKAAQFQVVVTDNVGLDGTYTSRNQTPGSSGRVLQMVEFISRMQE